MSTYAFPFVQVATQALNRLQASLRSKSQLQHLLAQVGWQATVAPGDLAGIQSLLGWESSLTQVATLADDLRYQRGDVLTVAEDLISAIQSFYKLIATLTTSTPNIGMAPFNQAGFWPALAQDLPPFLLASELRKSSPAVYALLVISGVIEETLVTPTGTERLPYTQVQLHWEAIKEFLSNPVSTLSTRYGWGNNKVLDYQRVMRELVNLVSLFPITPRLDSAPAAIAKRYYTDAELESQRIRSFILPFIAGILPDASGAMELGVSVTPIPAPTVGGAALSHTAPAGFLLAPYLHGTGERSLALRSDLLLEFIGSFASDNAVGLEVLPGVVHLEGDPGSTDFVASVNLIGSPTEPIRFFGTDTTSRIELSGYALSVGVQGTVTDPEFIIRAGTNLPSAGSGRLLVYLEPGDGDNFMAQAFGPDPIKLEVGGSLTWSSRTGLGIDGNAGLHVRRAPNKTVGPLTLHDYTVDIAGQTGHPLVAAVSLGASLKLGPVTATVEQIGVVFKLSTYANGDKGLFDNVDVDWGFKAPTGIGIQVDSDILTGGGYLYLDPANHQYSGAANLLLNKKINLNALGLLQTQLPNNPDAYSLLLLITATFTPIELGLGFTLNGLGGLLGINRAASTSYLRGMVSRGELEKLLFPANVLDNPAAALATVDAAFPATEGRYIIGLLGELGWGVPTSLITLDVALLVELPAPVRLLILGVLKASLPSKTNELLKLRADFLGSIDFGAKKIAFDSTLSDSYLLAFSLSGDMAFRLYQGSNPVFLITAGGFHPSFQPPAGADLPTLRRLTLALAQGDDLRISLASYFAVTSNTVQFGSHLDLYLRLRLGLSVEGHFGFDVLFQFNPFKLLAHVEAGVAIKRGSSELLGIHLSLDVTGPGPWHVWGEASFKIWFVRISVSVDKTIGDKAQSPALPAPNVHDPLLASLNDAANWTVETPTTAVPGGVVLRAASTPAGQYFIDPRGTIVVSQRVAPLGITLDKYGNGPTAPTGGNHFDLLGLTVGNTFYALDRKDPGVQVTSVTDFFAPERFSTLSDAQKLSLPSFQLMPNGVRLTGLGTLGAGADPQATRRVVQYERLLLDGAATGTAAGGSASTTPLVMQKFEARHVQQLARNNALGREYLAAQASARAAQPVSWSEDTYAVVTTDTLDVRQDNFGSQLAAEQYRQAQADAADLLVMPSYQVALA